MITLPNGKICMNEQEAIQWLLNNYPIPFQCSANYAPNTEIGLGTIVNPTPSKVKVGSIIFFADSKVSTVIAVNETSFKCSEQYNDLVDDVVYVSNVQLNASGHLIVSLSNGTDIDAGLIKQVLSFGIDASQHLIANYNDGTSTDLGAIFQGNISISGNLSANNINCISLTASSDIATNAEVIVGTNVVANGNGSFGGNVTATKLKQSQPNYSNPVSPTIGLGLTISDIYSRVEEINGVLFIVFNYAITNNTGAPVTGYSLGTIYVNLTSEIAEKIIDFNGHSAHVADASSCLIMPFKGFCLDSSHVIEVEIDCEMKNTNVVDQVVIQPSYGSGITWANGETKYFTARTFLTLL